MRASPALFAWLLAAALGGCGRDEGWDGERGDVTFYRDIQPLAHRRCAGCHRSQGIAFAWPEHAELAREHADAISAAVRERRMPPWLPSGDCAPLAHERRLSDDEIARFARWAELGAPLGSAADAPDVDAPSAAVTLDHVDVTLTTPAFAPTPGKNDSYRCWVLDPALVAGRDLIGFAIAPSAPGVVHHVLAARVIPAALAQLGTQQLSEGWDCYDSSTTPFSGVVGVWVAGTPAVRFPEDTGLPFDAGDQLLVEAHYSADVTKRAPTAIAVALSLSDGPVARPAMVLALSNYDIILPPHSRDVALTASLPVRHMSTALAKGGALWGVMPHMHSLGRSLRLTEHTPAQESCLLDVPSWSTTWQEFYFHASPGGIPLAPAELLSIECRWDNPRDTAVSWGRNASDEMCTSYLYVTGPGP